MPNSNSDLLKYWQEKKESLSSKSNPYLEHAELDLWNTWEKLCVVPPMRIALVHVNLPTDISQLAQVILSTSKPVPHVATYLIGQSLDFMFPKIRNKIMSWNIREEEIKWIPRKTTTLLELKNSGFRLIGTSPHQGTNALEYTWKPQDVLVIGGAKGLSQENLQLMDEMIKIPCSPEVPFLTTPTVIPILTYPTLQARGLWN